LTKQPAKTATGRPTLDFTNPAACRTLTKVLLRHDFSIEWDLPPGALVPPITNRANYIHWLQDLVALSAPLTPTTMGLDIGCGANVIYPLLGASLCGWSFLGVDVTDTAMEWAVRNRDANPELQPLITLRRVEMQPAQRAFLAGQTSNGTSNTVDDEGTGAQGGGMHERMGTGIISGAIAPGERFAFCMCNPPFFSDMAEAGRNPATDFGGTAPEMVYPGGELEFVKSMVDDSEGLPPDTVHWYTSMVGKKGTVKAVRTMLYSRGVKVVRTTELCQVCWE
jgi:23S rRNA (adenine1618-N6)-methyltransferase